MSETAPPAGPPSDASGAPASARRKRQRRCAATGEEADEARLLRFVCGPEEMITPDVAAKLPGRGVWVTASRAAVEGAVKRNAFARSLKRPVKTPPDLADQAERLLARRCLELLGLARRAGALAMGEAAVEAAIRERAPLHLIEAADGAVDGRERLIRLAFGLWRLEPPVCGCFSATDLGMALGRDRVIHACLLEERLALAWAAELGRLSGFRAIVPSSWPESRRLSRVGPSDA
ncbi:MAG: RNA-binding protein [Hyphomonadaceae bacterium]